MHPERTPLLAANWKLNNNWEDCESFVEQLAGLCPGHFVENAQPPIDLLICPPFPYLALLGRLLDHSVVYTGAQDVSRYPSGAYTGEGGAAQLSDVGCDFAIVGHSERRGHMGEDDATVLQKLARLREEDVVPILCIGEDLQVREASRALDFTLGQLLALQAELKQLEPGGLVVAYEPVWAIGTGRNAAPEDAQEMAAAIRAWLDQHAGKQLAWEALILYGGSVKPDNIEGYLAQDDIDGALIGGASLKAESLAKMADLGMRMIARK